MDVLEAIKIRRSVRAFSDKPIGAGSYERLLEALRYAPSACNLQPWRFVLVEDKELRRQVAQGCNGQSWVASAPLIVVGCGMPEKAYRKMAGYYNSVDVDVAIALDHLSLAAAAEGLGTCWIGAFSEESIKATLGIGAEAKVVAMMPVGHPAEPGANHPVDPARRNASEVVFGHDRYA